MDTPALRVSRFMRLLCMFIFSLKAPFGVDLGRRPSDSPLLAMLPRLRGLLPAVPGRDISSDAIPPIPPGAVAAREPFLPPAEVLGRFGLSPVLFCRLGIPRDDLLRDSGASLRTSITFTEHCMRRGSVRISSSLFTTTSFGSFDPTSPESSGFSSCSSALDDTRARLCSSCSRSFSILLRSREPSAFVKSGTVLDWSQTSYDLSGLFSLCERRKLTNSLFERRTVMPMGG
mmetsp:Transcript_77115/g.221577  ORF Transcript_77115/g.221577 Transcript_77115/m.221577 type:complete len:231 (+) Transcript_77115:824-1516(+)